MELPTRLEVEFAPWISKERFLKTGSDKCGQFVILKLYKLRTYYSWKLSLRVSSPFQLASEATNVRECATILSRAARAWLLRGTACMKGNKYTVAPISYNWVSKDVLLKKSEKLLIDSSFFCFSYQMQRFVKNVTTDVLLRYHSDQYGKNYPSRTFLLR